jgi:phosphohistidine phosphatase
METWTLVEEELGSGCVLEIKREVYGATPRTLLDLVQKLPDNEASALVVGHNPGLEDLALALAASGDGPSLEALDRKYPTGALSVFEFQVDSWADIREGTGHLHSFVLPRRLS